MVYLPDIMPASFQATYTPVESAGTSAQIKHLARLMATQMTAAGIGPGELQKHAAQLKRQALKILDLFLGFLRLLQPKMSDLLN